MYETIADMSRMKSESFIARGGDCEPKKFEHEMAITSVEASKGIYVDVGVVDARETDRNGQKIGKTELYPLSNGSWLVDPHSSSSVEVSRAKISAEASKSRIIYIGYPNITISEEYEAGTPLVRQLHNVFNRYRWPAKQMLLGLHKVVDFTDSEEVEISGFAQGASEAVAIVEAITTNPEDNKNLKISRVKLIESLNDQSREKKIPLPGVRNVLDIVRILKSVENETHAGKHHFSNNRPIEAINADPVSDPIAEAKLRSLRKNQSTEVVFSGATLMRPYAPLLVNAIKSDVQRSTSGISSSQFDLVKFDGSGASYFESMEKTAKQILDASPMAKVALYLVKVEDGLKPHMEAFQDLNLVKSLYDKDGPLA
jgi:hypothetical protein